MTLTAARRGLGPGTTRPTRRTPREEGITDSSESQACGAILGGVAVQLMEQDAALKLIVAHGTGLATGTLAVASANLDHVEHFGRGGRWEGALDGDPTLQWLTLLDGSPLVTRARKLTNRNWPRLAGSDLIGPLLAEAEVHGLRLGFLGGLPEAQERVKINFRGSRPGLRVAGWWAPERAELLDPVSCRLLAAEIAAAEVDILVVCLGKPRQELWIAEYGQLTGAKVMLAFGAVIDFLAERIPRAPTALSSTGLEWAWRLALEPRRLAHRYLVDGPESYVRLRRFSGGTPETQAPDSPRQHAVARPRRGAAERSSNGRFSRTSEHTDLAVIVVTYNSANDVPALLRTLRTETKDQTIKVVVVDNSATRETLDAIAREDDVLAISAAGNLGYAGGINLGMSKAGTADSFLVLNPDTNVMPGSLKVLREGLAHAGVVVPLLLDEAGNAYPSLRREPSISRAMGDAALGSRFRGRPAWSSETDFDPESYAHPHFVDWATGAAVLVRADVAAAVGPWDEQYFLYSEETDYLRRVRQCGFRIWFEPRSRMLHKGGASGSSPTLDALLAVNRIRYVRKYHSRHYAGMFRAAVVFGALIRTPLPGRRQVFSAVAAESTWAFLPHANRYTPPSLPKGSIVIPAHNEEAVIARTLSPLAPYAAAGQIELIVACNGCTDGTEALAAGYPGVKVLSLPESSKTAALNAGNACATLWPRLYLDADVSIDPAAVMELFERLRSADISAARPVCSYDLTGSSPLVQAFYRARSRCPSLQAALWGAGTYAVSEAGARRLGDFPDVTADDLYIDRLFSREDKEIVATSPVKVHAPRSITGLMAVLRRTYRGNQEQGAPLSSTARTFSELCSTVRGPFSFADAAVYAGFVILARAALLLDTGSNRRAGAAGWERDNSSRVSPGVDGSGN